jgi:hypothetical protein
METVRPSETAVPIYRTSWTQFSKDNDLHTEILQNSNLTHTNVKVKISCYRTGVAQRVGRGIALLFHDRGTGR